MHAHLQAALHRYKVAAGERIKTQEQSGRTPSAKSTRISQQRIKAFPQKTD